MVAVEWQASLFGTDAPHVDETFTGIERIDLGDGAWIDHLPGWLRGHDAVMEELVRVAPWQSGERPMYDRIVAIPRLTAWWRTPFEGAPSIVQEMRDALAHRYDTDFTSCGCNLYRDGSDSVAWHGDRIDRTVPLHHIAIVSVGEPRKLLLRPVGGGTSQRFDLGRGDLFVMGGTCQRTWQHCVPKVASAGPRMSITFRHAMRSDQPGYARLMADATKDPYQEPENSTVNDWHGQKVDRLMEQAENAPAEGVGTDETDAQTDAEAEFNQRKDA